MKYVHFVLPSFVMKASTEKNCSLFSPFVDSGTILKEHSVVLRQKCSSAEKHLHPAARHQSSLITSCRLSGCRVSKVMTRPKKEKLSLSSWLNEQHVADPATSLSSVFRDLIFLWEQIVYSLTEKSLCFYLINIVNVKSLSVNLSIKIQTAPLSSGVRD